MTCYKAGHTDANKEPQSCDEDWQEKRKQQQLLNLMPHSGESVLMMVQWVQAGMISSRRFLDIVAFYDPSSSCSLVTISLAEMLNLLGQPITITLHTVNSVKQLLTKYNELYMPSHSGADKRVMAFTVEKISTDLKAIDISRV